MKNFKNIERILHNIGIDNVYYKLNFLVFKIDNIEFTVYHTAVSHSNHMISLDNVYDIKIEFPIYNDIHFSNTSIICLEKEEDMISKFQFFVKEHKVNQLFNFIRNYKISKLYDMEF